jgi:membrane protein YqaA with SNARE-associated domain
MICLNRIIRIRLKQTASSKWATLILFFFAFADASLLPLPVTTYFLLLILSNIEKRNIYLAYVILGTSTGAIAGYLFGHYALLNINGDLSPLGQFLFNNIPGFSEKLYTKIQILFSKWNFWILCGATATPIPYCIFSVFSGAFKLNIIFFLFATFISQGVKFYLVAFVTLNLAIRIKKIGKSEWKPVAIAISAFSGIIIFISNFIKNLFQIN